MEKRSGRIEDLLPIEEWFQEPARSSVLLVGVRPMRLVDQAFVPPTFVDFGRVRIAFVAAAFPYFDKRGLRIAAVSAAEWATQGMPELRTTPPGPLVLLATPWVVDGRTGDEAGAREGIDAASGLLAALEGRNIVYERVFENVYEIGSSSLSAFSAVFHNPLSWRAPDSSAERMNTIGKAVASVGRLPDPERRRCRLALRWNEAAIYDSGVDAFLRFWIAIETLTMPDTTNIVPLVQVLASCNGRSETEVRQSVYMIGRVFGLRGRIIHEGERIPVHADLLDFMAAIFSDSLMGTLGLPSDRRVEDVLAKPGFDLAALLV